MKNLLCSALAFLLALFVMDIMPILKPQAFFALALLYSVIFVPVLFALHRRYQVTSAGNGGAARRAAQSTTLTFIVLFARTLFNTDAMHTLNEAYYSLNYGIFSLLGLTVVAGLWSLVVVGMVVYHLKLAFADVDPVIGGNEDGCYY